jgi:RNA polymerase sigma-70 factor, ECF subfamily
MKNNCGNSSSFGRKNPKFVGLLTAHYYKIHSFILAMVPNRTDADDVLQNTITYLWEHFDDFAEDTNFLAWAVTIAKYQVFTYRKRQQRSKVMFSDETLSTIAAKNSELLGEMGERYEAMKKCLGRLSEKDKSLFIDQNVEGKKIAQIAEEQNVSAAILYRRYSRLKGNLLDCIRHTLAAGELS